MKDELLSEKEKKAIIEYVKLKVTLAKLMNEESRILSFGREGKLKFTINDIEKKENLLENISATSSKKIKNAIIKIKCDSKLFRSEGIDENIALAIITNYSEWSHLSGKAIGQLFENAVLNFTRMKQKFYFGDEDDVNKLEEILNRHSIALRKNKYEFNKLLDIILKIQQNISEFDGGDKIQVAFLLGGRFQVEFMLITLNSIKRIYELKNQIDK
ncbi:MAG TPA: hypothetical protein VIK86_05665 [Candidatus Paceibacterota bacterium]